MTIQKRQRGRPKSQFRESSAGTLQSLDRALGILTAVSRAERATLTDLSMSLGVPTATTHRILTTLQKHGFVAFDEERQDWVIGIEAYRTGVSFMNRTGLSTVSRPVMRHLMEKTGETANLAIPDGAEVVFVGQVETFNPIRAFFARGTRTSMHASGIGKAILAAMPPERVRKLLMTSGLTPFTDNTLVSPEALFADLNETHARGWSFDREERHAGMSCIGSVIYDEHGDPVAGVSISGPSTRFDPLRVPELGATVAAAAVEITDLIGGRLPATNTRSNGEITATKTGTGPLA
ncbi:IclR family transcriptional regulator [uncultured Roseobacter sp.]|uniref:IclR family transcriptional regulator n=1 Tax=uncultured Roseobacter sp. TaxID=114847 RepID=UPI002632B587|nr:IclR family transcriptional regulator [uncultured Roseobacter sp.]